MALMTGAQILVESLAREGAEVVFGYPGGVTLPVYDVFYDHPLRHVLVRHEENAAFAAQGLRGRPEKSAFAWRLRGRAPRILRRGWWMR